MNVLFVKCMSAKRSFVLFKSFPRETLEKVFMQRRTLNVSDIFIQKICSALVQQYLVFRPISTVDKLLAIIIKGKLFMRDSIGSNKNVKMLSYHLGLMLSACRRSPLSLRAINKLCSQVRRQKSQQKARLVSTMNQKNNLMSDTQLLKFNFKSIKFHPSNKNSFASNFPARKC